MPKGGCQGFLRLFFLYKSEFVEQLFRPASLGSEKWGMRSAHRTRYARTFAPREEFFPKMRFPGKMIGFDSASAEAELCEARKREQRGLLLPDHLPRSGFSYFPVQQLQEAASTTHLKLPGTAFQVCTKGSRGSCLWWLRLDLIEQSPGLFDPWCFSVHFSRKVNSPPGRA